MLVSYVQNIKNSDLTIYDYIDRKDTRLWLSNSVLELTLNNGLRGFSTAGLPNRTRSKVIKQEICKLLGYPIPKSFKKTQPRFPGQDFDVYVQKSNNLQIWNEEIAGDRRYVLIKVSAKDEIIYVKVVSGNVIALLDTTGTLTQKYQARLVVGNAAAELVSDFDTDNLQHVFNFQNSSIDTTNDKVEAYKNSASAPSASHLLPISNLFTRLKPLIGQTFEDAGSDQERNRGAALHSLVCKQLGYESCLDDGQFPDIRHQLLEIKLQTSLTIDLGLVNPDDTANLNTPPILDNVNVRHCDVRYALFYGVTNGVEVTLTNFFLTTGEKFFSRFPQFQGNVVNKKIQILLPPDFFG